MFKAKLDKHQKEVLLELLKIMSEIDGPVSQEEEDMIVQVRKSYHMKKYEYQDFSQGDIRDNLEEMKGTNVLSILTHAVLLALTDEVITPNEKLLVQSYFDLLSLENAVLLQEFIDKYGSSDFDVKSFFYQEQSEVEIYDESITMMNDFSNSGEDDIDETLLMKMKRGPIKKIWEHVMKLWTMVLDPKSDKAVKALGIGALLYLISPIDAIPDMIPVLGLTDDAGIIMYAVSQIATRMGKKTK